MWYDWNTLFVKIWIAVQIAPWLCLKSDQSYPEPTTLKGKKEISRWGNQTRKNEERALAKWPIYKELYIDAARTLPKCACVK